MKEKIMNEYAVARGFDNWVNLVFNLSINDKCAELVFHINAVTDLIQKELLSNLNFKLPSFLYKDIENDVLIGYHGDSVCTDEWDEFKEQVKNTPIL